MRYAVNGKCGRTCSLNEINLHGYGGEVHELYESGANREKIRTFLSERKIVIALGTIGRHKTLHLDPLVEARPGDPHAPPPKKKSHIEILQDIITAGGEQLGTKGIRISPEMTMKAIEMHHKLTEGSVWEDFLSAIGAMADESVAGGDAENPEAIQSSEEAAQGDSDVVGE